MTTFMRQPLKRIGVIIGGIVLAAALAFIFGLLVMLLWNWIMPEVFGLKPLTYWQSWAIVLLAHLLFKAGGHRDVGHPRSRDEAWKDRFRERFKRRFWDEGPEKGAAPEAPPEEAPQTPPNTPDQQ